MTSGAAIVSFRYESATAMCVGRASAMYFATNDVNPYTAFDDTLRGTEKNARKRYGLASMR